MGIENLLERESVLGVHELPVLVGCGTDGASAMYLIRMACEVSFKLLYLGRTGPGATLTGLNLHTRMLFPVISSMTLMKCCYEKSPRKCCEFSDLIDDLKEVFELPEGGNLPVQAHGSRWITYKWKAL